MLTIHQQLCFQLVMVGKAILLKSCKWFIQQFGALVIIVTAIIASNARFYKECMHMLYPSKKASTTLVCFHHELTLSSDSVHFSSSHQSQRITSSLALYIFLLNILLNCKIYHITVLKWGVLTHDQMYFNQGNTQFSQLLLHTEGHKVCTTVFGFSGDL